MHEDDDEDNDDKEPVVDTRALALNCSGVKGGESGRHGSSLAMSFLWIRNPLGMLAASLAWGLPWSSSSSSTRRGCGYVDNIRIRKTD